MEPTDQIKTQLGSTATFTWLGVGAVIFVIDGGLRSLLSLRAVLFLGIGMFAAAIVIGLASYKLFLNLADKAALSAGVEGARDAILRSFRQSRAAAVVLCVLLETWAYSSFFLQ
ncbi:MAG: hypothetical protein AB1899_07445 [Pseudomonadota bacterium]